MRVDLYEFVLRDGTVLHGHIVRERVESSNTGVTRTFWVRIMGGGEQVLRGSEVLSYDIAELDYESKG